MRIIIGAGSQEWKGWIPTGREELDLLDEKQWQSFFGDKKADAFLCEHVFEHLDEDEGRRAAAIVFKYLRPGGYIRVAVPDGNFPDPEYQKIVQVGGPGPLNHPAADHKILYDYRMMTEIFEAVGFTVKLLEYHDETGNFHQTDWDLEEGPVYRSSKIDLRNQGGAMKFPSLIIDAVKLS